MKKLDNNKSFGTAEKMSEVEVKRVPKKRFVGKRENAATSADGSLVKSEY